MSVDYRPYLTETDLRTAEDVLEWLDTLHKGPVSERIFQIQEAVGRLSEQLDRERRQACRRGALSAWRRAAATMRASTSTRGYDRPRAMIYAVWVDRWPPSLVKQMLANLAEALAFRAAARAK